MSSEKTPSRLSILQENASNHLASLADIGTRSPRSLGYTTLWLSVAISESDEPVKLIDRIKLADAALVDEVEGETEGRISAIRDSVDARKVGRRIINLSLPN